MTRTLRSALFAGGRAALLAVVAAVLAVPAPPARAASGHTSTKVAPQTGIRVVAVMTHRTYEPAGA